jgi:uncharacterized protein YneF (UPF0154 family)
MQSILASTKKVNEHTIRSMVRRSEFFLLSALLLAVSIGSFFLWENYSEGITAHGMLVERRRLRSAQLPAMSQNTMIRYLFEDSEVKTSKARVRDILRFVNHL